ncbi:hypothetical protein BFP77_05475 [Maribacter sp. 4U21]|uniref:hypothetical protein n=1 Tax=Maribacter sp. 4U21 TaxID=1889779 RepID=UPI000C15FF9A|nr:hypothetical protein [Maribacter sp. 4U21]PIB29604.1 hypothetical protein BFP77_05475 [Maribacter sp. 4U21]
MKKYRSFLKITMLVFAVMSVVYTSFASSNSSGNVLSTTKKENPFGVWLYTAEGTSPEYRTGMFFIREENGEHIVEVQLDTGTLSGQDVQVSNDMIKFNMNIEGLERISVVLMVSGNTIEGETSSARGIYKISGTRKIPPQ